MYMTIFPDYVCADIFPNYVCADPRDQLIMVVHHRSNGYDHSLLLLSCSLPIDHRLPFSCSRFERVCNRGMTSRPVLNSNGGFETKERLQFHLHRQRHALVHDECTNRRRPLIGQNRREEEGS